MDLQPGDVFAGHRIEGVAGRGGMGVVYRAVQLSLDRIVALKTIAPALAADPAFAARFVRESKAAAAVEHPNVIPIFSAGEDDGVLYIVMRYIDGPDLRSVVRAEGRLAPERAAAIVAQVAAALDAAHARGLVHRDVKPANVLLDRADHAYLTDFGLIKRLHSSATVATRAGGWVGTLGYVAPEQIRDERVDARTDVYALGCVLVHALTARRPTSARATRRRCGRTSTTRRPTCRRASRRASGRSCAARWPRTRRPVRVGRASSAARCWRPSGARPTASRDSIGPRPRARARRRGSRRPGRAPTRRARGRRPDRRDRRGRRVAGHRGSRRRHGADGPAAAPARVPVLAVGGAVALGGLAAAALALTRGGDEPAAPEPARTVATTPAGRWRPTASGSAGAPTASRSPVGART
jgi:hypothetical protein